MLVLHFLVVLATLLAVVVAAAAAVSGENAPDLLTRDELDALPSPRLKQLAMLAEMDRQVLQMALVLGRQEGQFLNDEGLVAMFERFVDTAGQLVDAALGDTAWVMQTEHRSRLVPTAPDDPRLLPLGKLLFGLFALSADPNCRTNYHSFMQPSELVGPETALLTRYRSALYSLVILGNIVALIFEELTAMYGNQYDQYQAFRPLLAFRLVMVKLLRYSGLEEALMRTLRGLTEEGDSAITGGELGALRALIEQAIRVNRADTQLILSLSSSLGQLALSGPFLTLEDFNRQGSRMGLMAREMAPMYSLPDLRLALGGLVQTEDEQLRKGLRTLQFEIDKRTILLQRVIDAATHVESIFKFSVEILESRLPMGTFSSYPSRYLSYALLKISELNQPNFDEFPQLFATAAATLEHIDLVGGGEGLLQRVHAAMEEFVHTSNPLVFYLMPAFPSIIRIYRHTAVHPRANPVFSDLARIQSLLKSYQSIHLNCFTAIEAAQSRRVQVHLLALLLRPSLHFHYLAHYLGSLMTDPLGSDRSIPKFPDGFPPVVMRVIRFLSSPPKRALPKSDQESDAKRVCRPQT